MEHLVLPGHWKVMSTKSAAWAFQTLKLGDKIQARDWEGPTLCDAMKVVICPEGDIALEKEKKREFLKIKT